MPTLPCGHTFARSLKICPRCALEKEKGFLEEIEENYRAWTIENGLPPMSMNEQERDALTARQNRELDEHLSAHAASEEAIREAQDRLDFEEKGRALVLMPEQLAELAHALRVATQTFEADLGRIRTELLARSKSGRRYGDDPSRLIEAEFAGYLKATGDLAQLVECVAEGEEG